MAGTGVMGKVSDDAGKEVMNEKLCRKSQAMIKILVFTLSYMEDYRKVLVGE